MYGTSDPSKVSKQCGGRLFVGVSFYLSVLSKEGRSLSADPHYIIQNLLVSHNSLFKVSF